MGDTRPANPAVKLYELLDACDAVQIKPVEATGHIKCDMGLVYHLHHHVLDIDGYRLPKDLIAHAFKGQPVKQVWHVVRSTVLPIRDIMERDRYLRIRAGRRRQREAESA